MISATWVKGALKKIFHISFRYSAKTSATAAMAPVSDTKNMAHPRRKATIGP